MTLYSHSVIFIVYIINLKLKIMHKQFQRPSTAEDTQERLLKNLRNRLIAVAKECHFDANTVVVEKRCSDALIFNVNFVDSEEFASGNVVIMANSIFLSVFGPGKTKEINFFKYSANF